MKRILILALAFVFGFTALSSCSKADDSQGKGEEIIDKEIVNLSDAYGFLNNSSDAYTKVRCESGFIGVAPGRLNEISYSDDKAIIQNALDKLNVKITKAESDLPTGGNYVKYSFYKGDGSYDFVYISNDLILYNDIYYKLEEEYGVIIPNSNDQIYSLNIYDNKFKVYKNDEALGEFNRVHELEFIKTNEITSEPICRIKNDMLELVVYSKNEFSQLVNYSTNTYEYYRVVGDVDFSSII